jgi:signal peptidase II
VTNPRRLRRWLLALSLPLYVLDQLTKHWVVKAFEHPETGLMRPVPVIEGFFDLVRVHNTGVAFGHFNGGRHSNLIFAVVASAALVFITVVWLRGGFPTRAGRTAAALLVAGVVGNLTDRLFRGYVVDFLHFDLPLYGPFPSFNVADSCITVAAFLLFVSAFQKPPAASGTLAETPEVPAGPSTRSDAP